MKHSVYLSGPIAGLHYDEAEEWRVHARSMLAANDIEGISPLRGKEALKSVQRLAGTTDDIAHLTEFAKPQAVMARDYFDTMRCDLMLVNLLDARRVSIGTMFEMAWAYQKRTPIVVVMEDIDEDNLHEHVFVQQATGFRFNNLDDALYATITILRRNT